MCKIRSLTAFLSGVCIFVCVSLGYPRQLAAQTLVEERPGISDTRPQDGPVIEVTEGFLVPYRAQIPGTQVEFEMIPLPSGVFMMGSPAAEPGRNKDEGPRFPVQVSPFWIGKHEVTWGEYRQFMRLYDLWKGNRTGPGPALTQADGVTAPTPLYDPSFTFSLGENPRHPAVTMTQYAARQYTKWLSLATGEFYRLPTEAEWEYACRAGTQSAFHFGDDPDQLEEYAWYFDNSDDSYHEVGQKLPNPWGLHDMHGNVAEMVLDEYSPEAYAQNRESAGQTPLSVTDALRWPKSVFGRVIRGGDWNSDPEQLRSAARGQSEDWRTEDPNFPKSPWWYTDEQAQCIGFRIVRPYEVPARESWPRYWDADTDDLRADVENRLEEGRGVLGRILPTEGKAAEDKQGVGNPEQP